MPRRFWHPPRCAHPAGTVTTPVTHCLQHGEGARGGFVGQDECFKGHFVVETWGGSACKDQAGGQGEVCKQGQQVWLRTVQLGKGAARPEVWQRTRAFLQGTKPPKTPQPRGERAPSPSCCNAKGTAACCRLLPGAAHSWEALQQVTGVLRTEEAAPREPPQPTPRRIRSVLNEEWHVASGGAARNQQHPSNEKHPKITLKSP